MSGKPIEPRGVEPGCLEQGGFTLIELLVVMSMTSLIALAMAGAMRTMAQTESRVDQRLVRVDDFRVASGFLRSTLGRVSARKLDPPGPVGSNTHLFIPEPQSLTWVGVMPPRHGAGGRSVFRLALESMNGQPALVIRFAPLGLGAAAPDWTAAQARVLAYDVTEFSLAYQDVRQSPAQWLPTWAVLDRLPSRVKLTIQTNSGAWPDLVIPMRSLPASTRGSGPTFGGGSESL